MIEINLAKMKKGTGTKKSIVRKPGRTPFIQEFASGQKEPVKKTSGRKGTGKIDKLPDYIKSEIIKLRGNNISGSEIKNRIETSIDYDLRSGKITPDTLRTLISAGVVTKPSELRSSYAGAPTDKLGDIPDDDLVNQPYKVNVTSQGLTDWAKKRGVAGKTRKTVKQAEKESETKWKDEWDSINAKNSKLEVEVNELHDKLQASRKDATNKQKVREKLRSDLRSCRAGLKS